MSKKSVDVTGSKAQPKAKKPYIQKDTIGSTQTAEIVYGLGDGENGGLINGLNSIILDSTRVVGDSGEVNFNEVKYEERKGTIDQEPLKIIEDTSVERGLNVEFRYASPAVSTFNNPDVDKYVVRISIPQLMQNKDNGDSVAATISYAIDIAVDGGAFEEVVNATATEKITNGFEIDHEIEAPAGNVRTIRVRRLTADSTSQLLVNKTYLAAISEVINAKFSYPTIHHVGLIFNAEQFNSVPKAVFHYYGRLIKVPTNYDPVTRKYTGIWNGTFKVVYSNNPAWVLYDILTDRRSGLGRRIDPSMIDKWELYQIGVYCDELVPDGLGGLEPRFVCNNLILNARQDAYQVIRDIASIFRGQAFWNGSAVVTRADAPRDIDYAISMASVVSYSYSGTSSNARHNVVKVQYYDKNNENKAAYEFATDYNSIRETGRINEIEIRAFGCTSAGQAQRLARYTLLSEQTETRLLVAKVALDAFVNMQIGDIFAWSDRNLAGSENGGRIVAVDGKVLTLDRDVTTSAAIGDDIFVNTGDGKASSRTITAVNKNKVTVDTVIERAEPENVWVIDAEALSLLYFKLEDYKINPSDNTVDIRGVQHVRSKFSAIDTDTAIEAPPFSKVEIETLRAPENVTTNFNVRVDQGMNVADVYVAWGQVKGATRYTVEFRRDSQAWRTLGVTTGVTHTIDNVTAGIYEVRIRAMDGIGNMSPYGYSSPLNVNGAVMLPPKLTSFSAVGKMFAIEAIWTFPAGTEAALATVIEYSNVDPATIGAKTQQLNVTYPQTSFTFNALSAQAVLWMRAAIVDKYNQIGEFTEWTSAQVDTDPKAVLDLVEGHINAGSLDAALKDKIQTGVAAKAVADAAKLAASAAQSTADTAKTNAATAQAAADAAKTAASNAQAAANTGVTNAAAAKAAADAAQVTANTGVSNAAAAKSAADSAAAAVNTEVADRKKAITDEQAARADAIATVQDGITKEIKDRKDGDTATLSVINNYKASNDTALANVRSEVQAATSANTTQAGQITAIDGRLSTAEGKIATKAEVSAVNSLDTKINNVDGKLTTTTNSVTALQGRVDTVESGLTKKADASALNNYYTKTQTDDKASEIAAGQIASYDAKLVIGGVNQLLNSEGERTNTASSNREYLLYERSAHLKQFYDDNIGQTVTISGEILVPVAGAVAIYSSNVSAHRFNASTQILPANVWTKFEVKVIPAKHANYDTQASSTLEFYGTYNTGRIPTVRKVQIESGNKATAWSPSPRDTQSALDANANAITATNAEVTRVDGLVTTQGQSITNLQNSIAQTNNEVSKKASAAAVDTLTNRVTTAEGGLTSVGNRTTSLENAVNHATTGLSTKASTAALNTLDSKVTTVDGKVTTATNNITSLQGRVSTVENGLSTKADASALNNIYTKSEADAKAQTIAAGEVSKFSSDLKIGGRNLCTLPEYFTLGASDAASSIARREGEVEVITTANANPNFYAYLTNNLNRAAISSGMSIIVSYEVMIPEDVDLTLAKDNTEIEMGLIYNLMSPNLYAPRLKMKTMTKGVWYKLTSNVGSVTNPAGNPLAIGRIYNAFVGAKVKFRRLMLESATVSSEWELSDLNTQSQLDANAAAIQDTTTEVSRVNGVVTSQGTQLSTLQNSLNATNTEVSKKANATTVDTLTNRVTATEGGLTSVGNRTTSLENAVNHTTTGLSTKASTAALNTLDSKVTTVDGKVTTANNNISTLNGRVSAVEGTVATKADASALNNIYTKTETDAKAKQIAAGEVSQYDASLVIGGTNLLDHDPTAWNSGSIAESRAIGSTYAQLYTALNTRIRVKDLVPLRGEDFIVSVKNPEFTCCLVLFDSSGGYLGAAAGFINYAQEHKVKAISGGGSVGVILRRIDNAVINTSVAAAAMVQVEYGNKATDWSPSVASTQNQLDANATAIANTNTEVSRVNGVVVSQGGQITSLNNSVSSINGNLAKKADASTVTALTNRVTDAEGKLTSQAGSITNLSTSLAATDAKADKALPRITSIGNLKSFKDVLKYYYSISGYAGNIVIQTPITFTSKMFNITLKGYNYVTGNATIDLAANGYAYSGTQVLQHGVSNFGSMPIRVRYGVRNGCLCLILNPYSTANFAYPQFSVDADIGYTAAPDSWQDGWSAFLSTDAALADNGITAIMTPSNYDVQELTAANASAINSTNADVSRIDGVVAGHTNQLTNLTTSIAGKADASALSSLAGRVAAEEGKSTSQGTAITNLENAVNNTSTGLPSKASSSALTTLNNQVQHSTTGLSAVNSKVDSLKATIENTTNGLATKASSTALDTLSNKVNHSTTGLDAIANKTTSLESSLAVVQDVVTISDTRSTNQPPSWYLSKYPRTRVNEFKTQTAIGVGGFFGGTYCNLETLIPYGDLSGGNIIQTATSANDPSAYVQRQSTSTSAWSAWSQPVKDLRDGLAGKAEASALTTTNTEVSRINGVVTSQASSITNLTSRVGTAENTLNVHASVVSGVRANYMVKMETNGVIGGFGIIQSTGALGTVTTQFGVNANNFFIGDPSSGKKPFIVLTGSGQINGVTVPAGTYIDTAMIGDATIDTAMIRDLNVTTAKIANLAVTEGKIANLSVDTLKIKDNAVTVPIGVSNANSITLTDYRPTFTDMTSQLNAWETKIGDLASITINRAGGKCRVDAYVNVTCPDAANSLSAAANGQGAGSVAMLSGARFFISVYRGTKLIGRASMAPTAVTSTLYCAFNGTVCAVSFIDEDAISGVHTYTLKAGFANINTAPMSLYLTAQRYVYINERAMSILELKK